MSPLMEHLLWAGTSCLLYMLISWKTGTAFLFGRFALYATAPNRDSGAVPRFRAQGQEAHLGDYRDFVGMDPERLYPPHTPCSLEWMTHEAKRYISKNLGAEPGPVPVEWGFVWLTLDAQGTVEQEFRVVQKGWAWPRT